MDISKARCAECGQPLAVERMRCRGCDIALEGQISGPFYYLVDSVMFVMPGFEGSYAFENTAQLSWRPSERFMLTAGGRVIFGGYPYGQRIHGVPMLDAKFGW